MAVTTAPWRLWVGMEQPAERSLRCFIGRTGVNELWWARFPPPATPIMMKSTGLTTTTILELDGEEYAAFNWNVPGDPTIPSDFNTTWAAALVDLERVAVYFLLNQVNGFGVPNDIYGGTIESGQAWGQRRFLNMTRWFSWFPGSDPFSNPGVGPTGTLNFIFRERGIQVESGGLVDSPPDTLRLIAP